MLEPIGEKLYREKQFPAGRLADFNGQTDLAPSDRSQVTGGCNKNETTWYDRSGTTNLQYFLGLEVERQVQYEQVRIVQIAYCSNLTWPNLT